MEQLPPFAGECRFLDPDSFDGIGGDRDGPRNTDFQGGSPNIVLSVAISPIPDPGRVRIERRVLQPERLWGRFGGHRADIGAVVD